MWAQYANRFVDFRPLKIRRQNWWIAALQAGLLFGLPLPLLGLLLGLHSGRIFFDIRIFVIGSLIEFLAAQILTQLCRRALISYGAWLHWMWLNQTIIGMPINIYLFVAQPMASLASLRLALAWWQILQIRPARYLIWQQVLFGLGTIAYIGLQNYDWPQALEWFKLAWLLLLWALLWALRAAWIMATRRQLLMERSRQLTERTLAKLRTQYQAVAAWLHGNQQGLVHQLERLQARRSTAILAMGILARAPDLPAGLSAAQEQRYAREWRLLMAELQGLVTEQNLLPVYRSSERTLLLQIAFDHPSGFAQDGPNSGPPQQAAVSELLQKASDWLEFTRQSRTLLERQGLSGWLFQIALLRTDVWLHPVAAAVPQLAAEAPELNRLWSCLDQLARDRPMEPCIALPVGLIPASAESGTADWSVKPIQQTTDWLIYDAVAFQVRPKDP
ncbi:MAG: hypothetical protein KDK39_03985 [Leptospiraceae bacterium]|nr:hypothetical protein [Leptospiraceae bacterium]